MWGQTTAPAVTSATPPKPSRTEKIASSLIRVTLTICTAAYANDSPAQANFPEDAMACGGCAGARQQFFQSARRLNLAGVAGAMRDAYRVNVAKIQGNYHDQPAIKATPYRRPPERTP